VSNFLGSSLRCPFPPQTWLPMQVARHLTLRRRPKTHPGPSHGVQRRSEARRLIRSYPQSPIRRTTEQPRVLAVLALGAGRAFKFPACGRAAASEWGPAVGVWDPCHLGDLPKLREGFGCIVRRCPNAQAKLTGFDVKRSFQNQEGTQWNRGVWPVPPAQAGCCRGQVRFPGSRDRGAADLERFDASKPACHGVEEEAHSQRQPRV